MKKAFKNEQGYALILVLLTIVIIAILTPPLVASVANSAKQNNITEEKNQLLSISEMGQEYFRSFKDHTEDKLQTKMQSELEDLARDYKDTDLSQEQINNIIRQKKVDYITDFSGDLDRFFSLNGEATPQYFNPVKLQVPLSGNEEYQFYFKNIKVSKENSPAGNVVNMSNFYIDIEYTSVGSKVPEDRTEEKTETLRLNFGNIR